MQDVQERSKCVSCDLSDLRLVHQCLVENVGRVLLLVFAVRHLFTVLLLLFSGRCARNVEAHLNQLIHRSARFSSSRSCAAQMAVRSSIFPISRKRKFHRDLVLASQVGVGYLGVRNFERRLIANVENELTLAEIAFSPVPPAQSVLFLLQVDAVPQLETLGQAVVVVLLEPV